ncbi:uncharacterized protein LTR77_004130 [Saxophila tyrrhenica]|uniref:Uncharacterized protein n=1 Tax=Saxophila tyrrhenica TaxID=1690608 RepID=A0AAV9PCB1_9PEZI|nr:hypothetical protein LTR77_004130 [Saxophila tyrrhenica]
MATATTLLDTLSSFTAAADSASQALPDVDALLPPTNGISLLDAKNEIFLSYLQALALRNLNVIRSLKDGADVEEAHKLSSDITSKLVEHRVYLERGVRPLEQKIKYQTDKVVKAADDEERLAAQKEKQAEAGNKQTNGKADGSSESEERSEEESDEDEDEEVEQTSYRPNLAGFGKSNGPTSEQTRQSKSKEDGVYRPPRVSATSMPTTEQREKKARRQPRSATMEEYVNTELSNAPQAVPSIGSTIAQGGRKTKDARQMAKEQERRDYEETHLVRLPPESKKELAKQRAKERRGGYGGEEWRDLGSAVDRIGELTRRKGKEGALEKSRKRRAVEDGPRGDGIGDAFDVKKRRVMKKMRR